MRKLFISTDGKFHPCERVMSAYNIGSVDKGLEINKILTVAHRYAFYSAKDCINCWGAKICGVCFMNAVKNNDFNLARKREKCMSILKAKHETLVMYATIMEKNPKAFDFTEDMKIS